MRCRLKFEQTFFNMEVFEKELMSLTGAKHTKKNTIQTEAPAPQSTSCATHYTLSSFKNNTGKFFRHKQTAIYMHLRQIRGKRYQTQSD